MATQDTTGIRRNINAGKFSGQGLQAAYKNEAAFRQELVLALMLRPFGFYPGDTGVGKALINVPVVWLLVLLF